MKSRRPRCAFTGGGDSRTDNGPLLASVLQYHPEHAIKIATLNDATYLGQSDHIGSIAAGKNADLVVVKGDPSIHINDVENVELVFRDGLGFNSAKLLESVKGRFGLY